MPYKDAEKREQYIKKYHIEHRVEININQVRWQREHWQEYYAKHKEELKTKARYNNRRIKFSALYAYSGKANPYCARCEVNDLDVLTIDHINGGGNAHRRQLRVGSGTNFFYWLKRNGYPEGYQVLCWNCNVKKRIVEGC